MGVHIINNKFGCFHQFILRVYPHMYSANNHELGIWIQYESFWSTTKLRVRLIGVVVKHSTFHISDLGSTQKDWTKVIYPNNIHVPRFLQVLNHEISDFLRPCWAKFNNTFNRYTVIKHQRSDFIWIILWQFYFVIKNNLLT